MVLNDAGNIVKYCWYDLTNHYLSIELNEFVIMPDHIHGIVIKHNSCMDVGTGLNLSLQIKINATMIYLK